MTAKKLERLHRSIVGKFNRGNGSKVVYYKDKEANIEKDIMPLVEVLNNERTLTTHACGGHWEDSDRFQYPYVNIYVFSDRREWNEILKQVANILEPKLWGKLTVEVSDVYRLHNMKHGGSQCRIIPKEGMGGWAKRARILFKNSRQFRKELDSLIVATSEAIKKALVRFRSST